MREGTKVLGTAYVSQATVTRPADTTAYTAGDVVGGVITLAGMADSPFDTITLEDADLRMDVAAVPSGMTSFRMHMYSATPGSAIADNTAWDLPSGDRASYLGYVDLGSPADVGSTLFVQTAGFGTKVIQLGVSTSLFAYLVTNGGFTPGSADVLAVRLCARGV